MNTFLSSYNKMKSGSNAPSSMANSIKDSSRLKSKGGLRQQNLAEPMNPIAELEASDSETKTRGAEGHHSDREFEDEDQ